MVWRLFCRGHEPRPEWRRSTRADDLLKLGRYDRGPWRAAPAAAKPAGFREYPIGEQVEQNQMRIAAVWLPSIQMDGMVDASSAGADPPKADIHATEGNPNGFGQG